MKHHCCTLLQYVCCIPLPPNSWYDTKLIFYARFIIPPNTLPLAQYFLKVLCQRFGISVTQTVFRTTSYILTSPWNNDYNYGTCYLLEYIATVVSTFAKYCCIKDLSCFSVTDVGPIPQSS